MNNYNISEIRQMHFSEDPVEHSYISKSKDIFTDKLIQQGILKPSSCLTNKVMYSSFDYILA